MLSYVEIPLDSGAPDACVRCGSATAVAGVTAPVFHDVAEVEHLLAQVPDAASGTGILFTGAAPLRHPEWERIVRVALAAGARRVGVRTGGEPLAESRIAEGLLAAGVRFFEVALPGSSGAAAIAGIEAVRSAAGEDGGVRVAVRGRVPVCDHTAQDLPALVMSLAGAGVTDVTLVCPPGAGARRHLEWVGAACDTGTVNRVWVSVTGVEPGLLGEKALHASDVLTLAAMEGDR